jgi:hypothetical protein
LINVPIALGSLFVVPRLVAESRVADKRGFDLAGAVTVTLGLSTLVYALVKAPSYGWSSLATHLLFAGSIALLGVFAVIERRTAAPLIPAGFLHRRATLVPNLLQLLVGVSAISSLFLLTLYTQQVLRYTPLEAGVAYLPLAVGVASATGVANKLVGRLGPRPLASAGLAIASVGMLGLANAPAPADYWRQVMPAMVIVGLGAGLSFVSITTAALARIDDATAGIASGLLSTTVQIGGALGVAVLAGVIVTQRASDLVASGSTPVAAQLGGLQLAFLIAAGVAQAASLLAMFALGREKPQRVAPAGEPSLEVTS